MLKVRQFAFNDFGVSTFVVYDEATRDAIVVDPGMASQKEYDHFDKFIKDEGLHLQQVVNTHMHVDHCVGDNYVRDKYGVKVAASLEDSMLANVVEYQANMFGFSAPDLRPVTIDVDLKDGDVITVGESTLSVLSVPGHSPGSIALYSKDANFVIDGDVLFKSGVGRTDLPGGNATTLYHSITKKLGSLPGNTMVLPGHGPHTTIAAELG